MIAVSSSLSGHSGCYRSRKLVMRRLTLLGIMLSLSGCGFGDFLSDTHTFRSNPNGPIGSSPNMLRVQGERTVTTPLTTEPGDVWPGPIPPTPTLSDLQKQQNSIAPELGGVRRTPNMPLGTGVMPSPAPYKPMPEGNGAAKGAEPGSTGRNTDGQIIVPNGNGTSTVIEPDGTVRTIPTPKDKTH
ncbi:Hypothetical protein GbCGDNIH9_2085 [Granulibacter bethesdensis]|uniref:Uncharacterized protein n=2 Tax=Granulibacter bethesdensis TaxID=364410 RepID=A0AAC9K8P0_9PROT|nr:Hypothetical protein GbCGDNIH9_2085 [Granulibacter bethesdensis]APH62991.1 Hypothetical protein GbCGDNIH8_2085 [Granulibacter bethesdensis]